MERPIITPAVPLFYIGHTGMLLSCRLVEARKGETVARVRVSVSRWGYKRGEIIEVRRRDLTPVECVRRRKLSTAIVGGSWGFQEC